MSREQKLAKNTVLLAIGTFIPKLSVFITLPVLTACLTKEQYGAYDLVSILVSFLLPVTTLQIHTAAFRFLIEAGHDKEKAKLYLSNILAFVITVSISTLVILFFFLPVRDLRIKVWICIFLFFDTIVEEIGQVARGLSRNLDYSISAIISACLKLILTVSLVYFLKYELFGAIVALAVSPVISLVYLVFRIRVYELVDFRLISWPVLKKMLAYSWPMVPNNLSGWVMRVSDRVVVTAFMGLSANAVYSVANKVPHLLSLAQSTFSMAWQENASIVSRDEDAENYYSKMLLVMTNFYAGCLGIIIACTPILFKILIRGDYAEAYLQMPILFFAMFFSCMANFLGGIYIACKATKSVGITTVIAAVCNIVVDLALIKKIGLFAASGSTLVSYLVLFTYRMIDVRKLVAISFDIRRFFIAIAVIVLECTLCFFQNPILDILNLAVALTAAYLLNKRIVKMCMNRILLHGRIS
ncbi:MAG: oligosaccharide flippase family protein [Oscillospiraceae bacterium]|nr:oligosaccharide flippase family protein [Oscillospiraceae bacterium]